MTISAAMLNKKMNVEQNVNCVRNCLKRQAFSRVKGVPR